jgi:hypothetical protein
MSSPSSITATRRFPVLATTVALLAACSGGSPSASESVEESAAAESTAPSVAPSASGPPSDALDDVVVFDVEVEFAPDWPALLDDSLWVYAERDIGEGIDVVRLDPDTGAEHVRIPIPGGKACQGVTAAFDSLWVCSELGLARIDPATNAIVTTVTFATPVWIGRPAVADDALWMVTGDIAGESVVRIDPATNTVTTTYPVGHAVGRLAFGLGYATGCGCLSRAHRRMRTLTPRFPTCSASIRRPGPGSRSTTTSGRRASATSP